MSSLTDFAQFLIGKRFAIPSPSKILDKQFGRTESADDMTNSDALVREKLSWFKKFLFLFKFFFQFISQVNTSKFG